MKIRIENNSIRFRITPEELAQLNERCRVEASARIYSEDGRNLEGEFIYALTVDKDRGPTRCRIEPSFIMLILDGDALKELNVPGNDGFVYRRESEGSGGEVRRFMAYVEIDRPVKKRNRPEDWMA